jgi:3-oxoadipate enol-lactonase
VSENHTITANGADLRVRIDGAEHLPWLVLSNSLATDMSLWEPQLAALTEIRRVLRYDTRGHGGSGAPRGPYDFGMLTGDVIAVMDHFGIASADILGLSLGGMTALGLGLDYPRRVDRIMCCCARADFPPAMVVVWDERIAAVTNGGLAAIAEGTLSRWFTPATHAARPELISHTRRMILETSPAGYCGCAEALKTLSYFRRLPELRARVLYVAGEADPAAPPGAMRAMADATSGAKLAIIRGAAHIANLENAPAFTAAVCGFLQDSAGGP